MNKITLSRQQLYELVWSQPISALSNKYILSEISFRSLCIKMSIPLPREGHWENIKMGKEVKVPPLTSNYHGPNTISLSINDMKKKQKVTINNCPSAVNNDSDVIQPLNDLILDNLVVSAGKALRKKENSTYDGMARSPQGEIGICVTPPLIDRALTFMDLLIKALRMRGHHLIVKEDATCVIVFQQELKIYCREKNTRIPTNDKWQSHVFVPSGLLLLKLEGIYDREWVDSKSKLIEEHIPSMLKKFEEEANRRNDWKAKAEKQRIEREEQQKIQKERQEKHDLEMALFKTLFQRAIRWEKSRLLRNYINELESRMTREMPDYETSQQYIEWARKKADWYDPFTNAIDEWLTDKDLRDIEVSNNKNGHSYEYPFLGASDNDSRFFPGQNWFQK